MLPYGITKSNQQGSFLYSMSNFTSIIKKLIEAIKPTSFCEIGVDTKVMTQTLIDMAKINHFKIYGIDPTVTEKPLYDNYILINKSSFTGLDEINDCDAYFIDGDHNYYTVSFELNKINSIPASEKYFPLIFIHDTAWPNDRRDAYYLPTCIPSKFLHDYDDKFGVTLEHEDLTPTGIASGNNNFAWRNIRGGDQNGVLTAVEDFKNKNPQWNYILIPGIFGLSILYKNTCPERFIELIAQLNNAVEWMYELISTLEYNRLQLFCEKNQLASQQKQKRR